MSAPDTNIDRQEKDHAPSLLGIKGALIAAFLILLGVGIYAALAPVDAPVGNDATQPAIATEPAATTPAEQAPAATATEPAPNATAPVVTE